MPFRHYKSKSIQELEKLTLEWVNGQRARRGQRPLAQLPMGRRKNAYDCVIARAFADIGGYGATEIHINRKNRIAGEPVALPKYAKELAWRFDAAKYTPAGEGNLVYARAPEPPPEPDPQPIEVVHIQDKLSIRERARLKHQITQAQRQIELERREALRQAQAQRLEDRRKAKEYMEASLRYMADMGEIATSGEDIEFVLRPTFSADYEAALN